MSKRRGKEMTEEDRILWDMVARTVARAPASRPPQAPNLPPEVENVRPEKGKKSNEVRSITLPSYQPVTQATKPVSRSHLDTQTLGKLAKGRLALEARVDLHGMRQDEAYGLLLSFVARAHARGIRYVLVITGKGSSSGGDGVLRRSVPGWLSTAPFKQYVSAHESAARGHGGTGALYVRLKRVHG